MRSRDLVARMPVRFRPARVLHPTAGARLAPRPGDSRGLASGMRAGGRRCRLRPSGRLAETILQLPVGEARLPVAECQCVDRPPGVLARGRPGGALQRLEAAGTLDRPRVGALSTVPAAAGRPFRLDTQMRGELREAAAGSLVDGEVKPPRVQRLACLGAGCLVGVRAGFLGGGGAALEADAVPFVKSFRRCRQGRRPGRARRAADRGCVHGARRRPPERTQGSYVIPRPAGTHSRKDRNLRPGPSGVRAARPEPGRWTGAPRG